MTIFKYCFLFLAIFYNSAALSAVKFVINGVEKEGKNNVVLFLQELNSPQNAESKRYLEKVEQSTRSALNALGYYQVKLDINVSGEVSKQTVTINITSGVQTRIKKLSIKVTGEGKNDPQFKKLLKDFPIKKRAVLDHSVYETAKSSLIKLAQQRGYFDAQYEKSQVEVTSKDNSAIVYLWFNTGVRYQFGELMFDETAREEKYIRALQPFAVGDPFDSKLLSSFNAEINTTGYFKNIMILPMIQEKKDLQIPLHIIANSQPEDSFTVGIGYSTDEGIRGKISWVRPWVNEEGHSIDAAVSASEFKQSVSVTYKIPLADPIHDYASIQNAYKKVDLNDTNTEQYLLTLSRNRRSLTNWQYSFFIKYDFETGIQGQQDFTAKLIIPGVSASKTQSKGGINALWGDNRMASLEASPHGWFSSSDIIRAYGKTKFLRTYNGHQFLAYAELGAIYADSIYDVPPSMRFFTGGDQSVRGYSYESIAPKDDDGYLIGGRYLTVASVEYRYPLSKNWKFALFGDAGTATDDFSEDISSSAGFGFVWASPVGPIRLYMAKPFTEQSDSLAFHFIIGPEL